jgi:hypothetical protein
VCQVGSKCSVSRAFDFLIACIKGILMMDIEAVVFRGIQYCFYTYQLLRNVDRTTFHPPHLHLRPLLSAIKYHSSVCLLLVSLPEAN